MLTILLLFIIIIIVSYYFNLYISGQGENIIHIIESKLSKYEARFGDRVYNYLTIYEEGKTMHEVVSKLVIKNKIKSWKEFKREFNICNKSFLPGYETELHRQGSDVKKIMKTFSPI